MTRLRLVEESDVAALVDMGREMIAESSYAALSYAPEKVAETIRAVMLADGFAAVSTEDDQITGVILGNVAAPWFSDDRMGTERVLYVRPAFRGTAAAAMLVRAWTSWCFGSGAQQIRPGTAATSKAADALYRALGFEWAGSVFVLNRSV